MEGKGRGKKGEMGRERKRKRRTGQKAGGRGEVRRLGRKTWWNRLGKEEPPRGSESI